MKPAMDIEHMPPSPYLPHELIVSEILLRLPVESLLRFRCVCKAWRDTISDDTNFTQAHVRRHDRQNMKPSSLLIAPYIKNQHDDGNSECKVDIPGLYMWEENQRQDGVATLVYDMAWFPAEERWHRRHGFAHCDGLVMLPDVVGTVRVLNPATRRSLALPWSSNSTAAPCRRSDWLGIENAFGFGRDPGSGVYKVARFFHHFTHGFPNSRSLGFEVFTIGKDSCWRETAAEPPCPFVAGRTATFFKGSLIWMAVVPHVYHDVDAGVPRFVRFSLEDESFSVMAAPQWYHGPDHEESRLVELHGELALTCLNKASVEIWIYDDVNSPRWVQRHVLNIPSWSCVRLVAEFNDGIVFRDKSNFLWRQTRRGFKLMVGMSTLRYRNPNSDALVEYTNVAISGFDVIPYIPTLVPI